MSVLRFHLDEDCQAAALATALREHGVNVTTTNELRLTGTTDAEQLGHATSLGRCLVSNNIADFAALHSAATAGGIRHAGIVLFPQQSISLGETVRRLLRLFRTLTAEEMLDRLEWLSAWAAK